MDGKFRTIWFSLAFTAWCSGGLLAGSKPVAVVNGEAINQSELDAALKMRPQGATPVSSAQQRRVSEQILSLLIDDVLIRQFLEKNAPPASPSVVNKQMSILLEGLKAQNKSLADYCKDTQQTEKQLRTGIESMIRWNAYVANRMNDAELMKYYEANKDFFDKATVRCSQIVYRLPETAKRAERDDAAKKLDELRQQIINKKLTFAEAAKKFSHCSNAARGGDLGWIYRKWVVEEPVAKVAFAMKIGEMSEVVSSDIGVHLIVVTDRKAGEPSNFDKIRDDVRECYTEEMRLQLITDLRRAANIVINLP